MLSPPSNVYTSVGDRSSIIKKEPVNDTDFTLISVVFIASGSANMDKYAVLLE